MWTMFSPTLPVDTEFSAPSSVLILLCPMVHRDGITFLQHCKNMVTLNFAGDSFQYI